MKANKERRNILKSSRVYCGSTFLEARDLIDTNIKNRVELEYYKTKRRKIRFLKEEIESYGIEIVKKEYLGKKINIEKEKLDSISNKKTNIDSIIKKLKEFKVTPTGLKDVVDDIVQD